MREFSYQALTKDEELRTGQIAAASAAAALAQLESQGLTVLLIRQLESPAVAEPTASVVSPTGLREEDRILRERLSEMLEKRATLAPALAAFAEELPRGRTRRDLHKLSVKLHEGVTVDELSQSRDLTTRWLPLLGSGGTVGSGPLQDVFAEAERESAIRTQLTRSLVYPVLVLLLSFFVVIFLAIAVVPTISSVFYDFGLALPRLTTAIVNFSDELRNHTWRFFLSLGVFCGILYAIFYLLKQWILPGRWLGAFLNGNSLQVTEMAGFVRRLAEALSAGLPLAAALKLAGRGSPHRWLRREAQSLADAFERDPMPAQRLKNSSLPATVVYALQAGPEGTPNIRLLQELSEIYSERVRNRFDWATGFLPQFSILAIGIVVGIVVLALLLPLVQLINGLTG